MSRHESRAWPNTRRDRRSRTLDALATVSGVSALMPLHVRRLASTDRCPIFLEAAAGLEPARHVPPLIGCVLPPRPSCSRSSTRHPRADQRLTVADVAGRIGAHEQTVLHWIRTGELKAARSAPTSAIAFVSYYEDFLRRHTLTGRSPRISSGKRPQTRKRSIAAARRDRSASRSPLRIAVDIFKTRRHAQPGYGAGGTARRHRRSRPRWQGDERSTVGRLPASWCRPASLGCRPPPAPASPSRDGGGSPPGRV